MSSIFPPNYTLSRSSTTTTDSHFPGGTDMSSPSSSVFSTPCSSSSSLSTLVDPVPNVGRPSVFDYFAPKVTLMNDKQDSLGLHAKFLRRNKSDRSRSSEEPAMLTPTPTTPTEQVTLGVRKERSFTSPLAGRKSKVALQESHHHSSSSLPQVTTPEKVPSQLTQPEIPTPVPSQSRRRWSISPSSPLYNTVYQQAPPSSEPSGQATSTTKPSNPSVRRLSLDLRSSSAPDINKHTLGSSPLPSPSLSINGNQAGHFKMSKSSAGGARRRIAQDTDESAYASFESCINGALAHEKKAKSYGDAVESSAKAFHHFTRANDLLTLALDQRPDDFEALIYKASLIHIMSSRFYLASESLMALQSILAKLRSALSDPITEKVVPPSLYIAAQFQKARCVYLLATLSQEIHLSLVPRSTWTGECGELAREAVVLWQGVIDNQLAVIRQSAQLSNQPQTQSLQPESDPVDPLEPDAGVRERRRGSIANKRFELDQLFESYIELYQAAKFCAGLTTDVFNSDRFFDIAERALELALILLNPIKTSNILSVVSRFSFSSAHLLTTPPSPTSPISRGTDFSFSVQPELLTSARASVLLKLGPLKMDRFGHTLLVCPQIPFNQNQVTCILSIMEGLATQLADVYTNSSSSYSCTTNDSSATLESRSSPLYSSIANNSTPTRAEAKHFTTLAYTNLADAQFLTAHLSKRAWKKKALTAASKAGSRRGSAASLATSPSHIPGDLAARRRSSANMVGYEDPVGASTAAAAAAAAAAVVVEGDKHRTIEEVEEIEEDAGSRSKLTPQSPLSQNRPTSCISSGEDRSSFYPNHQLHLPQLATQSPRNTLSMSMTQYRRTSMASIVSASSSFSTGWDGGMCTPPLLGLSISPSDHPIVPLTVQTAEWVKLLALPESTSPSYLSANALSTSPTYSIASALSATPAPAGPSLAQLAWDHLTATLAPRVAAAREGKVALLVTAEVYATWAAKEVGWDWITEGKSRPHGFLSTPIQGNVFVSQHAAIGQNAIFTLLRTIWHKAVTTASADLSREEKAHAKERVERIILCLRSELGIGSYDLTRFKVGVERFEGDFEQVESLYWSGVSRTLKESGCSSSSSSNPSSTRMSKDRDRDQTGPSRSSMDLVGSRSSLSHAPSHVARLRV
ncbi:hypothetical protein [Phaffia rhodozyma]|uniref:Uncharacterized protein n=1 Tax=Phaffia rhodozyma TaxID=264483 RepID=A0A0F7SNK8_PHARH|nr:hypothetical protein [Phaffia rhodozyma]